MLSDPRRYIAIQAAVECVGNLVLNAAIGWYWTQGMAAVPLWGGASAALDLLPTGFAIAAILMGILTWRLHRRLRAGSTRMAVAYDSTVPKAIRGLPHNRALRIVAAGTIGLLAALVLLLVLTAAGQDSLPRESFIVLKALFAAAVAVATVAIAGARALGDGIAPAR